MLSNIVNIPDRPLSQYLDGNPWNIYEDTFKKKSEIDSYEFNIQNENDIFYTHNKIQNLKYSFYGLNNEQVVSKLCDKYIKLYFLKYSFLKIENTVTEFFKTGKLSDFHKIFLLYFSKIVNDNDWDYKCDNTLNKYNDLLKHNLEIVNPSKEYEFIKYLLYFNKIIEQINIHDELNDKMNKILISNIEEHFLKNIIYLIKKKSTKFYNELFTKPYFLNVINNNYIKYFSIEVKNELINILNNSINTQYDNEFYKDKRASEDIYNLIKFYNICTNCIEVININQTSYNWDNNILNLNTNYLCASMYYWINKKDINKIYEIIKFYSKEMPNKFDFLALMKFNIKKRAEHRLCYEFENIIYEYLLEFFNQDMYKKNLDVIKNLIEDIYLSEHMNMELLNLELIFQNNDNLKKKESMGSNFDIKKLETFISSNFLWNDKNEIKLNNKILLPDDLSIYNTIIEKYFKSKYDKRNLNISYSSSFIDISIGNLDLRLPITFYTVIKIIGNNHNSTIVTIKEHTNIELNELKQIIDVLKINNLVIEDNDKFNFNENIYSECNEKSQLNLMQYSKNNINKFIESDIIYDKDMILDSVITKTCKNNSPISFNRMLVNVRDFTNKYFIPDELSIKRRIKRLQEMEYILFNNDDKKYYYIP